VSRSTYELSLWTRFVLYLRAEIWLRRQFSPSMCRPSSSSSRYFCSSTWNLIFYNSSMQSITYFLQNHPAAQKCEPVHRLSAQRFCFCFSFSIFSFLNRFHLQLFLVPYSYLLLSTLLLVCFLVNQPRYHRFFSFSFSQTFSSYVLD